MRRADPRLFEANAVTIVARSLHFEKSGTPMGELDDKEYWPLFTYSGVGGGETHEHCRSQSSKGNGRGWCLGASSNRSAYLFPSYSTEHFSHFSASRQMLSIKPQ
jgi:hypothetical protein